MIKILIEINELEPPAEKKVAGRMACMSRSIAPVTREEAWLRDRIFAAIEAIEKEIGEKKGAVVSMQESPIKFKRRRGK